MRDRPPRTSALIDRRQTVPDAVSAGSSAEPKLAGCAIAVACANKKAISVRVRTFVGVRIQGVGLHTRYAQTERRQKQDGAVVDIKGAHTIFADHAG